LIVGCGGAVAPLIRERRLSMRSCGHRPWTVWDLSLLALKLRGECVGLLFVLVFEREAASKFLIKVSPMLPACFSSKIRKRFYGTDDKLGSEEKWTLSEVKIV
jgi:hypothetical protein